MLELAVLWCGVFLGAVVSGFSGFAFSAAAGAVLLHAFEPHKAIPLMMGCSIASQMLTMLMLRKSLQFRAGLTLLAAGVAGASLAVPIIGSIDPKVLRWIFGAFLAAYAGYLLVRARPQPLSISGPFCQMTVGAAGGLVGAFTAMPGALPSVWCELRGCTKEQQRGVVQPFILGVQLLSLFLFSLTPAGISKDFAFHLVMALPALCLGSALGILAFRRIGDRSFRRIVLMMLMASGLMMLR